MIGFRAPVRVRPRGARRLSAASAGVVTLRTGGLGFLGAAEDDQRRWLANFRRLLDGLDSGLQCVMRFTPGAEGNETGAGARPCLVPPTLQARRAADLAFAGDLGKRRSAQKRDVLLVIAGAARERLERQLLDLGLSSEVVGSEISPSVGIETRDLVVDDSGWHRTWYLDRFPGVELEPGWLLRLVPARQAISISWHIEPLPSGWVVEFLQRQLVNMRAARLEEAAGSAADPHLRGALPAAEELQRRLTASEEKAFHVSLYLTLTAASRQDLDAASRQLLAAARSTLVDLRRCTFRMAAGRVATLPLGQDRLQRRRVLDTSSVATLFPWLDVDLQQPAGIVLGCSRSTGCPIVLDPFDQSRYANANIGVFGHSGAGKTFLLSTLALGALDQGAQVFLIDPEHEYGTIARQLGGVDVRLALGSGHAINVLGGRGGSADDEAWLGPAVADAVDLAAVICGDLDEAERAVTEAAVREAYAEVHEPVLGDVARRLPEGSRAARILQRWSRGSLGAMFSCPTNVDLDAPIVAFGMRELRQEMVGPVHFLLAEALWRRIKERGRRRLLVIDELGLLFEDPTLRRFVVQLARRIRKYEGSLVFATQNPGDLLSSEPGSVVATNPALHFFGALRPGEAAKLQRSFQLSDTQRAMLETARRGEFLLAAGQERVPVRIEAPPWQRMVMRTGRDPPRSNI